MSASSQLTFIFATIVILIAFICLFVLYAYQNYLFKKIRSNEMGLNYKWSDYIGFIKGQKLEELWNYEFGYFFNIILRTPFYFFFMDLNFENEYLRKLNERRIKVCKFWLFSIAISFLNFPLQKFYVFA